ncbi:MAG: pyridoxamine 5'-phosphate oxidase family protein [Salinivirgaceae bacterium]|nr:pyridoxamine 5'-phosphate oxidase family protein [Salinivirgaceae bacterium]MDD4747210.1 pyridoxamine 5'-phosphate oxidase family protein [Salinivirgaceae bacterium]MDY0279247.1 pyridoxamine 5'-phosphate oxidase family protein [Salinivirgaceae bacterium]
MRKTTWVTKQEGIEEVINKANTCSLAMIDVDGNPYVVIMNFGYQDGYLYLHGDSKGKKMDALRKNPNVSIMLSADHNLFFQDKSVACSYGLNYRSVSIQGSVEMVEEYDEKVNALNLVMAKFTDIKFSYNAPAVNNVSVFRVKLDDVKCKVYGS